MFVLSLFAPLIRINMIVRGRFNLCECEICRRLVEEGKFESDQVLIFACGWMDPLMPGGKVLMP
jgi:hypothetical protein